MSRNTGQRSRQPQGTPIGGQFAPEHDGGPATSLEVDGLASTYGGPATSLVQPTAPKTKFGLDRDVIWNLTNGGCYALAERLHHDLNLPLVAVCDQDDPDDDNEYHPLHAGVRLNSTAVLDAKGVWDQDVWLDEYSGDFIAEQADIGDDFSVWLGDGDYEDKIVTFQNDVNEAAERITTFFLRNPNEP